MNKTKSGWYLPVVCALVMPWGVIGAETAGGAPASEVVPAAKAAKVPYHGVVSAIDPATKTFRLKGKTKERTFSVTETTKITRDGVVADLSTITLGEEVRGQAMANSEKWNAISVLLGAKAENAKKPAAVPEKN